MQVLSHGSRHSETWISYPSRCLVVHIATFLVVALAVLAARHLSFAAPALLVAAVAFTHTLEKGQVSVATGHVSRTGTDDATGDSGVSICADTEEVPLQLSRGSQQCTPAVSSLHLTGGFRTRDS